MPSTTRYLTILALGSVLFLTGTMAAEKGHEKDKNHGTEVSSFPGSILMVNPCLPQEQWKLFSVDGTNLGLYHEDKHHAWIHLRFLGKGMDDAEQPAQPVKVFLHLKAHVDPGAAFYDIPFESIWVDKGTHNFEFGATMRVFVVNGRITTTNIIFDNGYSLQCLNDTDPNAADHRFNNDKDEDDDRD